MFPDVAREMLHKLKQTHGWLHSNEAPDHTSPDDRSRIWGACVSALPFQAVPSGAGNVPRVDPLRGRGQPTLGGALLIGRALLIGACASAADVQSRTCCGPDSDPRRR